MVFDFTNPKDKEKFWHSSAHIMAAAVKRLFPTAQPTIGPPIEEGFYYDFAFERPFTDEDIVKINAEALNIIKERKKFEKKEISYAEAKKLFANNKFKLELIEDHKGEAISIYTLNDFVDLCRGPHVDYASDIKAFKLTKHSGAYWKGDSKNEQLQRIYGISFPDKKMMEDYVARIEKAERIDHRKLLKELDLAMFHEYSPGGPFFLPQGAVLYNELVSFIREEYWKRDYKEVITPQMFDKKLWEISGHWEHYKDSMFNLEVEGHTCSLKPMNCPSHCLIYNNSPKSYKDLPLRIADFCALHRNELSGALTGMSRVRKFSQDDAHIFCMLEQVQSEIESFIDFVNFVWVETLGFKLSFNLSTRPPNKLGSEEIWDKSEEMLKAALTKAKINYNLKEGDGAFYGPKIDIDLDDAFGRKVQCATVQLDFNLPHRFECMYEGADGKKHECVMIHRAVLGSLERFISILLESCEGKLPLWLNPVQVVVVPIADRHVDYCAKIVSQMRAHKIRAELDSRAESMNKKVREAQLRQANYILVAGDKELQNGTLAVRTRDNKVHGEKKSEEIIAQLIDEIKKKTK
jgi:threonyl-tRNA synthetase